MKIMSIEKLSAGTVEGAATPGRERDAAAPGEGSPWSRIAAMLRSGRCLGMIALPLVFGLYVRAIGFGTVYDDNVAWPWKRLRDVITIFTNDAWGSDGNAHSVYYRPVAMTWGLLMNVVTGGVAGWLHLSAILIHIAVMVLAYLFGRRLFGDERLALLTAVLFGLHPSKVESVAWISSNWMDGLGAVFFFACMIAFLKWRESAGAGWLAASVVWFAFAMFTKETMVFIPMLIAVYLWLNTPRTGQVARIFGILVPYGVVWAVYMAIRHVVIRPASADATYIRPTFTLTNVWTAPYAIGWYIRHLALPWGLSVDYAERTLDRPTLFGFVLPALGLLLLLVAAVWLWRRTRSKVAAFLMWWFVLTLAPAVIVAPMVLEHDRYLYTASYAFCALVAWVALRLADLPGKMLVLAPLCVVVLWAGLTWHEMGYWDSDATLWARSLEVSPSSLAAQMHTASVYSQAGDTTKALKVLNEGLKYHPNEPNLWVARAGVFQAEHQVDEARAGFLKVVELTDPAAVQQVEGGPPTRRAIAGYLRAVAAYQLAVLDFSTKNFVDAEHYARMAVSLEPKAVMNHRALSRSLREQGRVEEADAEDALTLRLVKDEQNRHP
jgi:tetratricopeptide (TPR) repeat protein